MGHKEKRRKKLILAKMHLMIQTEGYTSPFDHKRNTDRSRLYTLPQMKLKNNLKINNKILKPKTEEF
jgi:hypothetical protein